MVDLHMHSTASDGTDTILELLKKVRIAGIHTFSVTDHDTIEGAMAMESIVPEDMRFIRGIEFSCITEAGKCHILGYGYDKNDKTFRNILEKGREKRRNKLERRLAFLSDEFGIQFSEEELHRLRTMNSVGKPHLGNLLVSMGLANDKNTAIEKYINPCKTESDRLDADEVIKAILASGGIPVWAHPYGGTGEREVSRENFQRQLRLLQKSGLLGLECYYSKYTEEQILSLLKAVNELRLLVSGGSDYHGRNKTVRLCELNNYGVTIEAEQITVLNELARRDAERLTVKSQV